MRLISNKPGKYLGFGFLRLILWIASLLLLISTASAAYKMQLRIFDENKPDKALLFESNGTHFMIDDQGALLPDVQVSRRVTYPLEEPHDPYAYDYSTSIDSEESPNVAFIDANNDTKVNEFGNTHTTVDDAHDITSDSQIRKEILLIDDRVTSKEDFFNNNPQTLSAIERTVSKLFRYNQGDLARNDFEFLRNEPTIKNQIIILDFFFEKILSYCKTTQDPNDIRAPEGCIFDLEQLRTMQRYIRSLSQSIYSEIRLIPEGEDTLISVLFHSIESLRPILVSDLISATESTLRAFPRLVSQYAVLQKEHYIRDQQIKLRFHLFLNNQINDTDKHTMTKIRIDSANLIQNFITGFENGVKGMNLSSKELYGTFPFLKILYRLVLEKLKFHSFICGSNDTKDIPQTDFFEHSDDYPTAGTVIGIYININAIKFSDTKRNLIGYIYTQGLYLTLERH